MGLKTINMEIIKTITSTTEVSMSQASYKRHNQQSVKAESRKYRPDFHGAAIIDEDGNEHPITEKMVRKAIKKLKKEEFTQSH